MYLKPWLIKSVSFLIWIPHHTIFFAADCTVGFCRHSHVPRCSPYSSQPSRFHSLTVTTSHTASPYLCKCDTSSLSLEPFSLFLPRQLEAELHSLPEHRFTRIDSWIQPESLITALKASRSFTTIPPSRSLQLNRNRANNFSSDYSRPNIIFNSDSASSTIRQDLSSEISSSVSSAFDF